MPTRNVVVTQRQADMIDELVETGVYQNASEVLREGLRLVQERRDAHAAKVEALRMAIQVGIDAYEAGDYVSFDDEEALDAHLKTLTEQAIGRSRRR
jgi:antitoxin ParD1/3/4